MFAQENMPANHKPDPPTIARHKIANPKVILNIGGLKHEVFLCPTVHFCCMWYYFTHHTLLIR